MSPGSPECPTTLRMLPEHPFSFFLDGRLACGSFLDDWHRTDRPGENGRAITAWTDPASGLVLRRDLVDHAEFGAVEWLLTFGHTGSESSPIVSDVRALDMMFRAPLAGKVPYFLHRTNGSPADETDFAASRVPVGRERTVRLSAGGGRSSNHDFPFFAVETQTGTFVVAIGWSGQWIADVSCDEGDALRISAGLERTHFRLHPGESARGPRILVLFHPGDAGEAKARFRRLIHDRYCARRNGVVPLPAFFSNTCFTRGGGWLNECDAENQISLIRAYAPLGVEAVITDAGWFEGGWPDGAGNWTQPRKDAYPEGMGPVAAAAKEGGLVYGLWFEPERVVEGSWVHRNRPEWILASESTPSWTGKKTFLLDFGREEVRDWMFGVVKGYMDLPGFRVYRQDFNMDPLPYWRDADAPDRVGMTEMRYVAGLYAYWDRIAAAWPDALMEECASGGRRIDLETIMRMHIHQKTDYWFDDEADQAHLWGLSQYLPNNAVVAHLKNLDDYSFHSTLASSLCIGWIADDPGFDAARAMLLTERYRAVRHLLTGAWYGLLGYSMDRSAWMASQYHRPDLDEGIVLLFRRSESPYPTAELALRGLDPDRRYALDWQLAGRRTRATGAELMRSFPVSLPERRTSELIRYGRT